MKTIQCAYPRHYHNGFVVTCRLWTASGGVHALLVLEPTECSKRVLLLLLEPTECSCRHKAIVVMRRMGALDCLHDVTVYLYYAFCFMLIEHSVCHEPISVLINVFVLLA